MADSTMALVPIVALLTDFGLADPYVGAMKGAILTVCPAVTLVDIAHELPAHDVLAGALGLEAAYRFFPAGTIFVAVVDPGVGSARRGLALASGGQTFVGPDNGVLTLVLGTDARAHALERAPFFRSPVSPVFHGRDVFGPVAGHIALGRRLDEMGPAVSDPVRLPVPVARRTRDGWEGEVVHVDRFGNLVTSLTRAAVEDLAGSSPSPAALHATLGAHTAPFVRTYSEAAEGTLIALLGSGDRLEVAVNRGSAARAAGAGAGTIVRLARRGGRQTL